MQVRPHNRDCIDASSRHTSLRNRPRAQPCPAKVAALYRGLDWFFSAIPSQAAAPARSHPAARPPCPWVCPGVTPAEETLPPSERHIASTPQGKSTRPHRFQARPARRTPAQDARGSASSHPRPCEPARSDAAPPPPQEAPPPCPFEAQSKSLSRQRPPSPPQPPTFAFAHGYVECLSRTWALLSQAMPAQTDRESPARARPHPAWRRAALVAREMLRFPAEPPSGKCLSRLLERRRRRLVALATPSAAELRQV